ncbi:AAA family ATPase [Nostoc sp. UCD121]|uniref:McrB family protein n=1 Tax=unclassified Nostoc TaxID=2593658 RepID=UPI0016251189|nr:MULTISPECIES: AAA family ATPase [unclassified Nostoc]MBC1220363.1 AAA family ATPase [Nostoc sp. UCD120]MBC1278550.1 AAA family ATPase [Nostoc sp. UCD121]
MNQKNILTWGDVAYASRIATGGSKQEWEALELIWQAWEIIIYTGLATYSNKRELLLVVIRFFAIVSFYLEFFNDYYWEYYIIYYSTEWLEGIHITHEYNEYIIDHVNDLRFPILPKSEPNNLLLYFVGNALEQVMQVLMDSLDSDSMLFKSAWEINHQQFKVDGDIYELQRIEAEIISENIFFDKMVNLAEIHENYNQNNRFIRDETAIIEIFFYEDNTDIEWMKGINNKNFQQSEEVIDATNKFVAFFSCYQINPNFSLKQCSEIIGFDETDLKRWIRTINRKKQIILSGSPGTGKTFIAEKLAKHLIGGSDGFPELVQFHPAYSYEDFIQGIRPQSQDGQLTYPLLPGSFLKFCKEAEYHQGTCVLIIDEINRANLAQVFGELMYLLEYRDREILLAGGNRFRIPKNVRIIGTMNTADRSIANIDHALRRRFAFIELRPNYKVLRSYHQKRGFTVEGLINILEQLNQAIADKNYEIGISFFLTDNLREDIEDIWRMEIEPYLEEYFFNQLEKVDEFRWDKIKDKLWI